jgi:hypothetical protein
MTFALTWIMRRRHRLHDISKVTADAILRETPGQPLHGSRCAYATSIRTKDATENREFTRI